MPQQPQHVPGDFGVLGQMPRPCKPDSMVSPLCYMAPSSQPTEDFANVDSMPCLAGCQKDATTATWSEHAEAWTSMESGSTMCSTEAVVGSQSTRKSFYSTGLPEDHPAREHVSSPPNRLLHDLHDAKLHKFLEDMRLP